MLTIPLLRNDHDHGAAAIDIDFKTDDAGRYRASSCSPHLWRR
jgi:hypothetical protein